MGVWNGTNFENLGKLGDWTCKQITFDNKGQLWAVSDHLHVGLLKGHPTEPDVKFDNRGHIGNWKIAFIAFNPRDEGNKIYAVSDHRDVGVFAQGKMTCNASSSMRHFRS